MDDDKGLLDVEVIFDDSETFEPSLGSCCCCCTAATSEVIEESE